MPFLTSYTYRGVELNDGVNYSIPLSDQALDDLNSVTATWAYRKDNVPVQTGLTIKEGVFVLNIHILPQSSSAAWEAKLNTLKTIFNTRDAAFYSLNRQLPHEQYYKYLSVAPREMTVNRAERRVSVTFQTADKTWQDATQYSQQITLFDTAARTEDLVINYGGLYPAEPVITLEALTPGTDGPIPLYYREVTVYSVGAGAAGHVLNFPLRVVNAWDTSTLVSTGKMRSDGLDITVTLPDGTGLRRYIGGAQASRKVWVLPHTWPHQYPGTLVDGPGAGAPLDPPQNHRSLLAADTVAYFSMLGVETFPAGKLMIDDEIISYTGVEIVSSAAGGQVIKLTGLSRGLEGTTAADHYRFTPMKRPTVLRVNYGYAAGYSQAIYNDLNGWPLIDYETSSNQQWNQTDTYDNNPTNRPWVWRADIDPAPLRTWETINATPETETRLALYGTYQSGSPNSTLHHRLMFPAPGYAARTLSYIYLKFTLKGGQAGYPSITVRLMKQTTNGTVSELWSYTHNSAAEAAVNTGWVFTNQRLSPAAFYFIRLDNAAPGAQVRNVRLDGFDALLDQDYWTYYPGVSALGAETGLGTGVYPIELHIQNVSDTAGVFDINTRLSNNQSVTLDAAEHTVTGMLLNECSYRKAIWLRLLPGANTVRFTGPTGAGQMRVTIAWRERF